MPKTTKKFESRSFWKIKAKGVRFEKKNWHIGSEKNSQLVGYLLYINYGGF